MRLHAMVRGLLPVVVCLAGAAAAAPSLERGEYLVRGPAGCGNCHTPKGPDGPIPGKELAGSLVLDIPEFTAIAANITPARRVAQWSDAELARAIREGKRPDGTLIGFPMPIPVYRGLSDEDVASIVMFLRSLAPVQNELPASTYRIALPPDYGPPVESVTAPERGATAEYGAYLAGPVAHCIECHSPMGPQGPMIETDLGRGGLEFHGPWGVSVSANLTSHADGLAAYTDEQIATMITKGVHADGKPMLPPMPYTHFARFTEDDLKAVILYLRTLPPLPDAH